MSFTIRFGHAVVYVNGKDREHVTGRADVLVTMDDRPLSVIELKRPTCKLGQKELGQIENYAFSIADDERFDRGQTSWTFVLIGNELAPFAEHKCRVQGQDFGHIHESDDGSVNIYVKRWSTVIDEAKWRYQFFREKLELEVTTADGVQYLRTKHNQRLPHTVDEEGGK